MRGTKTILWALCLIASLVVSVRSQDAPTPEDLNELIQAELPMINGKLAGLMRQEIDLFGLPNNHLDPLQFNGHGSTSTSGQSCVDLGFLGHICAEGKAEAGVNKVNGLSELQIVSIKVTTVTPAGNDTYVCSGTAQFSVPELDGDLSASASGGVGIDIPVSASGSIRMNGVTPHADFDFVMDTSSGLVIMKAALKNLAIDYAGLNLNINGLGPLNNLVGKLVDGLKDKISPLFRANGDVSSAVQDALQDAINGALPYKAV
eukprot:Colp12_sorted_trinity150504_noHs@29203